MTLTQAVHHRDALVAQGVRCQIKHTGSQVWLVFIEGVDYQP